MKPCQDEFRNEGFATAPRLKAEPKLTSLCGTAAIDTADNTSCAFENFATMGGSLCVLRRAETAAAAIFSATSGLTMASWALDIQPYLADRCGTDV